MRQATLSNFKELIDSLRKRVLRRLELINLSSSTPIPLATLQINYLIAKCVRKFLNTFCRGHISVQPTNSIHSENEHSFLLCKLCLLMIVLLTS